MTQTKKRTHILLLALGQGLYAAILCCAAFWQLQRSCAVEGILAQIDPRYLILSLMVLAAVYLLLSIPWRTARTGGMVFSAVMTVLALINYFTLQLHGSILTVEEIQNFRTAMDVVGQYNFLSPALLPEILVQLGVLAGCLILSWIQYRFLEYPSGRSGRARRLGCLLCAAVTILLFSGKAGPYLKNARSSWKPTVTVQYHGYPMVLTSSMMGFQLMPPDGYSDEALDAICVPETAPVADVQPDIILILNETFFDPALVADIQTDKPYLSGIAALDNALRGNAVARCGGTNKTEFELLTSNSQSLVGATPFNVLHMDQTASMVSLLKEQGYYTIGMHCSDSKNYNRDVGYADLDFDEIHFEPDFQDAARYAARYFATDESVYANLIRWYEDAQVQRQPVFAYCLTIQNHGSWDQNPPEEDLVHILNGSGNQEELNEFLSCIHLSDQAFTGLCDYFRTVDRPVIVCMVGDHSASFVNQLSSQDLGDWAEIRKASVPFVIWANFPLPGADAKPADCSVTALGPMLLEQAGVAMSPFYRYVLELNRQFPVITDWGQCVDSDGNLLSFAEKTPETAPIWDYLYLSYNNLLPESLDGWFTLSRETLNKSPAAGQRIFCPSPAVSKLGNTYSIPPISILWPEPKSLAASSCRFNQSFPNQEAAP